MAGATIIDDDGPGAAPFESQFNEKYSYFVLFMLMLTYTGHSIDRAIIGTVMGPIQAEFALTDSQLGLLAGTIYAVSNALFVLPIGYLADRSNRRNLLGVCAMIWSGMTMLAGGATSFFMLVATRAGVGASEAAGTPVSTSLIADYFPPERRASAISMFYVSASIGGFLALAIGGYIVQTWGWRVAMVMAGLPGFLVAIAMFFTVKEPRRTTALGRDMDAPGFFTVLGFILRQPALLLMMLGGALINFVTAGVTSWMPTYYTRILDIPISTAGTYMGIGQLVCGIVGGVGAGFLTDRLVRRDRRWPIWLLAIFQLMTLPFYLVAVQSTDLMTSVICLSIGFGFSATFTGPLYSQVQTLVGSRMRALAVAILVMMISLLGYGLGAQATGLISDMIKASYGDLALRQALVWISCVAIVVTLLFILASFGLIRGQQRVRDMEMAKA